MAKQKKTKIAMKTALRMDIKELTNLKRKELSSVYETIRKEVQRRPTAPKKLRKQLKAASSFRTKRDLARQVFRMQLFLASPSATVKGKQEELRRFRELMEQKTGIRFKSMKEYEKYRDYMDGVAKLFPELFKEYYEKLTKLYRTMTEQHISMEQSTFTVNAKYWAEHVDEIERKLGDLTDRERRRINAPHKIIEKFHLRSIDSYHADTED